MVHRTARVALRVTPGQRRRCFGLLRSGGDVWACVLEVNAWARQRRDRPVAGYQELCRLLAASGPGTFSELDTVGARSVLRRYAETRYGARSWARERRVVARIEASTMGLDIRFVVTSFARGSAEWVYDGLYCARGQAENLVKLHKAQLASDRTSCRSPLANQVRLVLHTAAYWLLLTPRDRIPRPHELAAAEFTTLRSHLLKVAGRVIETASRIRIAFAAACPHAVLFRGLVRSFHPAGP